MTHPIIATLRAQIEAEAAAVPKVAGEFVSDYCGGYGSIGPCYQVSGESFQDDEPMTLAICPADDYTLDKARDHADAICSALTAVPRDAALKLALLDEIGGKLLTPEWHEKLSAFYGADLDVEQIEDLATHNAAMSTLRLIAEAHGLKMEDTNND